MNRALWNKAFVESRWTLLGCAALMFVFHWLFVWITKQIPMPEFTEILFKLPPWMQNMFGMDLREVATYAGRISLAYIDPTVLFLSAVWAIARGSDAVSGEIGRGTMEMVLAQPVRRITVLAIPATVLVAGAAVLSLAAYLGTCAGLATVELGTEVPMSIYFPAAVNLFALTFFTASLATLASSWDRYRWRTIGLVSSFYVVQLILKMMARTVPRLDWLMNCTFLGAYQPQILATRSAQAWELSLYYDGFLLLAGAACFAAAAAIFCRRDLPAPLYARTRSRRRLCLGPRSSTSRRESLN